jgi:Tol biopolymer transport system component
MKRHALRLLLVVPAASLLFNPEGNLHASPGRFSEFELGSSPGAETIILAENNRHAAYLTTTNGKKQVLVDGQPAGPQFDDVFIETSVSFSRDGKRIGYAIGKEDKNVDCTTCGPQGKWHAVIDGMPGPEYQKVHGIRFSPDGRSVVYGAILKLGNDDQWLLVRDGEETLIPYEAISRDSPVFSPDGKKVIYVAKKGEKAVVVTGGKEDPAFDKIVGGIPLFSPDGDDTAYIATVYGTGDVVVSNGRPGPAFDHIPPASLLFSPSGGRLAYGGQRGGLNPGEPGRWVVVTDGKAGAEYEQVDNIRFSPDGKHLAYKAKKDGKWMLVLDERPGPGCEELAPGFPIFSPDSSRIAYGLKEGGFWKVAVVSLGDAPGLVETVGGVFDGGVGLITFSPDGKRLAFGGKDAGRRMLVLDGKRGRSYDLLDNILFSPDSKRVAFEAGKYQPDKDDIWFVVLDGEDRPETPGLIQKTLLFSGDSRHFAYKVMKGDKQQAIIDGQAGPEYKIICQLLAAPDGGFESIATNDKLCRMIWRPGES